MTISIRLLDAEQLEGKIQERYGISKDAVRKDVDDWRNTQ
jgi:uncharacterized protein YjbJ (UPF0337 family)